MNLICKLTRGECPQLNTGPERGEMVFPDSFWLDIYDEGFCCRALFSCDWLQIPRERLNVNRQNSLIVWLTAALLFYARNSEF